MQQIKLGKKIVTSNRPAFVMGILNVTPDSFFKESRGGINLALKLIDDGADIIDIGAESTRPGFIEVDEDEQLLRILPIIREVRKHSDIPISIDTRSANVMKILAEEGADIYNDVSSLQSDNKSVEIVAKTGCSVILMHGFGIDENHPTNSRITSSAINFLQTRSDFAIKNGIKPEQIIWDPGIGFGKTMDENILLIKSTDNLCKENYPVVMAVSRKRVISYMSNCEVQERLTGTLAVNQFAVEKGAKILRVHDVKQTIDMLNVMKNLT